MSDWMMRMQLSSDDSTEGDIVEAGVCIGDVYALLVGEYPQLEFNTWFCRTPHTPVLSSQDV